MVPAVQKLADVLDVEALDEHLGKFPQITHVETKKVTDEPEVKKENSKFSQDEETFFAKMGIPMDTVEKYGDVKSISNDGVYTRLDGSKFMIEGGE